MGGVPETSWCDGVRCCCVDHFQRVSFEHHDDDGPVDDGQEGWGDAYWSFP